MAIPGLIDPGTWIDLGQGEEARQVGIGQAARPVDDPTADTLLREIDRDVELDPAGRPAADARDQVAQHVRQRLGIGRGWRWRAIDVEHRMEARESAGLESGHRIGAPDRPRPVRGSGAAHRARVGSGRAGPRPPGTVARPRRRRRWRARDASRAAAPRRAPAQRSRRRSWSIGVRSSCASTPIRASDSGPTAPTAPTVPRAADSAPVLSGWWLECMRPAWSTGAPADVARHRDHLAEVLRLPSLLERACVRRRRRRSGAAAG